MIEPNFYAQRQKHFCARTAKCYYFSFWVIAKSYHYHWNDRELKPAVEKIEPLNALKSKTYSIFKLLSVNFFQRIIGRGLFLLKTINLIFLRLKSAKTQKLVGTIEILVKKYPRILALHDTICSIIIMSG